MAKNAFRPAEFCERNSISRSLFYSLVGKGQIKLRKIGAASVVLAEDEAEWLKSLPAFGEAAKPSGGKRKIHKLSPDEVEAACEQGFYADGGNLYLQVAQGGSKSWVFRYKRNHKTTDMGLGSVQTLSLSDARSKAREYRKSLLDGRDPIEVRDISRAIASHTDMTSLLSGNLRKQ